MSGLRAKRPLDASATRAANDDFYARHPELVRDGQRQPLDPDDPAQAALRREWMQAYAANGGAVEPVGGRAVRDARQGANDGFGHARVGEPGEGCPPCDRHAPPAEPVAPPPVVRRPPPPRPAAAATAVTCELTKFELWCEHRHRKAGPEGILMVVPSSTAALGDTVTGQMTMVGGCGQHPSWSVDGVLTRRGSGARLEFSAQTWKPAAFGFFSLKNVDPQVYRVQAGSCSGGARVYEVRAYPPGKVAAKLDVGAITDRIRNALKILPVPDAELQKWTGQWFRGSVEYSGAWKEDEGSWKACYEQVVTGGFDPLFGVSYKGPVYPLTLVPGWLSKWVKAGLFFEIKFGAKTQFSYKAKYWPHNRQTEAAQKSFTGGGTGGGALSLELKLASSEVVEGAVSGETSLTAEVEATAGNAPAAKLTIKFDGVKGKASVKAAWGWVELSREFQLIQEREIYSREWSLAEDRA